MAGFRQGIHLQSYAQSNPLEIYQREGYTKFNKMNARMNREILVNAMRARIRVQRQVQEMPDAMKGLSTNQDLSRVRAQGPVVNKDPFANVGPNDTCPCGSGKKYKFCHGLLKK